MHPRSFVPRTFHLLRLLIALAIGVAIRPAVADTGPFLVRDIHNGTRDAWPTSVTNANGSLFFTTPIVGVEGYTTGSALCSTDGTAGGAVRLAAWDHTWGSLLVPTPGRLFAFVQGSTGPDLWSSD